MDSRLVTALRLGSSPIAVILTDTKPAGALQFKEGAWGCVATTMIAVSKGRTAVFDRATFGCAGGGTGLGFGDQYEQCGLAITDLLSNGNEQLASPSVRGSRMAEGEHFFESPEVVRSWLATVPFTDVPTEYVVMKPLEQVAEGEEPAVVVFLANADQLSALVLIADYQHGSGDSAVARFGGACQSILFAYAEGLRERPRGVIGFFDISRRKAIDRGTLSFTVPYSLFLEMEANVEGSFLEMEDWLGLQGRQEGA